MTRPPFPIIVGCGSSGTTLLRAMLDRHPELAVSLLGQFPVALWRRRARYETPGGFDLAAFAEDLFLVRSFRDTELDPGWLRDGLSGVAPIDYAEAVRRVFGLYAEMRGKPRAGHKSPALVGHVGLLARMLPDARFVHIVRDGRDVALSLLDRPWGPVRVAEAARYWADKVEAGRRGGRGIGPGRYLEVRYEDLVAAPEATLRDICAFLGLSFDPGMLTYHREGIAWIPQAMRGQHSHLLEPPRAGIRDWRRDMARSDIALFEAVAGRTLSEFGYERTLQRTPAPLAVRAALEEGRTRARWFARSIRKRTRGSRPSAGDVRPGVQVERAGPGMIADRTEVLIALSTPRPREVEERAIDRLLDSSDIDGSLDRLYPLLVEHKVLPMALASLEARGADLERLTVATGLFGSIWPLCAVLPQPDEASPGRISLAALARRAQEHRELLRGVLAGIIDHTSNTRLVAMGGRAFEAGWPGYVNRFEHDVDLYADDMGHALRLLEVLRSGMGFTMYRCRASRIGDAWLAKLALFRASEQGHELHVDVLVGGRPAGPGPLLLWAKHPIETRAWEVRWRGRRLLVPSAEDMLLSKALESSRKGRMVRRDVNDVCALVDGSDLDWDYLVRAASGAGVTTVLHRMVQQAGPELAIGVPPELSLLRPSRIERRALDRLGQSELEWERVATGSGNVVAVRQRRRILVAPALALSGHVRRSPLVPGGAANVPLARIEASLFRRRLRGMRVGGLSRLLGTFLERRAQRFGSLCELRPSPPAGAPRCVAASASRPRRPLRLRPGTAAILAALVSALPDDAAAEVVRIRPAERGSGSISHQCAGFLFSERGGSRRTTG